MTGRPRWQRSTCTSMTARGPATVLTVHNLAFQGRFPASLFPRLGLPDSAFALDGLEYHGDVNFLKGGLTFADRLTTVSPTYAHEITGPENGMGLDGVLRHRAGVLSGIMNGIDDAVWNPADRCADPGPILARTADPDAPSTRPRCSSAWDWTRIPTRC